MPQTPDMHLLDYLIQHYKDQSRSRLKRLLASGAVTVDGEARTQFDYEVTPASDVQISRKSRILRTPSGPARNMQKFVHIVYEDKWLLVVDKAVGVLSVPSGHHGFCLKTLLDEYLQRRGEKCTTHVVHRLDKMTSGLLLYAKSRQVQQAFTDHWREVITDRRYYAVTSGIPNPPSGTIRSYLTDDKFYYTHSSPTDDGGKLSVTHYHLLQVLDAHHALLDMKLETGRKNQIRVHLQDIGCPVVGDLKYGNGDDPIHRLGLHAYRLCFIHPVTGKALSFESPLPVSFDLSSELHQK